MIALSSDFSDFYVKDAAFMHILCLKAAFSGSALEEDMWVQTHGGRICGVAARCSGRLYIYGDGTDPSELAEFAKTVGYSEIFTERKNAENMKLKILRSFDTLTLAAYGTPVKNPNVPLSPLYNALMLGADRDISLPSFEKFAPDVSHRLRHGAALAVVKSFGAALAFTCPSGGIVNGISVQENERGKGLGSSLLKELLKAVRGEVFVCCDQSNTGFYVKNGFSPTGSAVIAR